MMIVIVTESVVFFSGWYSVAIQCQNLTRRIVGDTYWSAIFPVGPIPRRGGD
jgi:hypothetical protein